MTATHHSSHGTKPGSVSPLERVRRALGGSHSRDSSSDGGGSDAHHRHGHQPPHSGHTPHSSHSLSRVTKFGLGGGHGQCSSGAGRGLPHSSFSCPADLLSHGGLYHQGHLRGAGGGAGPVFGLSLASYPAGTVPPVLKILCDFLEEHGLETEGLFRVSASQKSVSRLRANLEAGLVGLSLSSSSSSTAGVAFPIPDDLLVAPRDVPPAAAVVKMFLRELPQPLVPREMTQLFVDSLGGCCDEDGARDGDGGAEEDGGDVQGGVGEDVSDRLRALVAALPPENFTTLKYLMEFLAKVAAKQDKNFMSDKSLGMVFAPCLFSLGDAMEMMAISHLQQHQPHGASLSSSLVGSHQPAAATAAAAAEMIDLPLAKKLCTQTQEVVVALIAECDKIFGPVEAERSALEMNDDDDCEQLFLKCRPHQHASKQQPQQPVQTQQQQQQYHHHRASASPEAETIPESESLQSHSQSQSHSHLVESVDEVTVIEADPAGDGDGAEDDEVVVVVLDDSCAGVELTSAAAAVEIDLDIIDTKRAMERTEEMPAFRALSSRPLSQLMGDGSGGGGGGSGSGRHHRRHHHRHHHGQHHERHNSGGSQHSSPSKRAKRQCGGSSASNSDSSCSSLVQNEDQENREPNLGRMTSGSLDDLDDDVLTKAEVDEDEDADPKPEPMTTGAAGGEEEGAADVGDDGPAAADERSGREEERRIWHAAMDLDDPPVVAQRAIQGQDEVMFSPRSSFLVPREEQSMKEREAGNRTSDHEVRRRDMLSAAVTAGSSSNPASVRRSGHRRRRLASDDSAADSIYDDVMANDDEDDYDEVEACASSSARRLRRSFDDEDDVDAAAPSPSLSAAAGGVVPRHQELVPGRLVRRTSPPRRNRNDPAYQAAALLRRRASKLKKRLAAEEDAFARAHGVRPTKADKMIHPEMRAVVVQLRQCKTELRRLVEDPSPATAAIILAANSSGTRPEFPRNIGGTSISVPGAACDLDTTVGEIEEHLRCLREAASRPEKLEDMSPAEITAEKLSLQRALVYLESKHGRPSSPEDKKIVWTLYDRYRSVKRAVVRLGMSKPNTNLVPILEHVQMDFPKSEKPNNGEGNNGTCKNGTKMSPSPTSLEQNRAAIMPASTSSTTACASPSPSLDVSDPHRRAGGKENVVLSSSVSTTSSSSSSSQQSFAQHMVRSPALADVDFEFELASYHESTVKDLEKMQRSLIERRKELKRQIRIFEVGFEDNNGRPPRTEEERAPLEKTYRAYKEVKARMRLIEALIQKQEKSMMAMNNNNNNNNSSNSGSGNGNSHRQVLMRRSNSPPR